MSTYKTVNFLNGKFPDKIAEEIQLGKLYFNLIGPYKMLRKCKEPLILKSVTMIDPVTKRFEITQYSDKKSIMIDNLVETTWTV